MNFSNITKLISENKIEDAKKLLASQIFNKLVEDSIDDKEGFKQDNGPIFGPKSVNPTGDNPDFKANGAGGRANQFGGPAHGADWINTDKETENDLPKIEDLKIPSAGRIRSERFKIATENLFPGNKDLISDFTHIFLPAVQELYKMDYGEIASKAMGDDNFANNYREGKINIMNSLKQDIVRYLREHGYSDENIKNYKTSINGIINSYLADGRQKTQIASKFKNGSGPGSDKSTSTDRNAPTARRL